MKKIFVLGILALAGVFVSGRVALGEAGAMRFVQKMESLMNEGDVESVCAMFHDDLEVTITDPSLPGGSLEGGKEELCSQTRQVAAALTLVPHTMNVKIDDVTVEREWMHPWTSTVRYTEDRSFTIQGANMSIRTISEDTITLVKTFSGVKLRKLSAEVSMAQ